MHTYYLGTNRYYPIYVSIIIIIKCVIYIKFAYRLDNMSKQTCHGIKNILLSSIKNKMSSHTYLLSSKQYFVHRKYFKLQILLHFN